MKKFLYMISLLTTTNSYGCNEIIFFDIQNESGDTLIKHKTDFNLFPIKCMNLEKNKSITVVPYISIYTKENSSFLEYKLYIHQNKKIISTINSPKKSIPIDAIYPTEVQEQIIRAMDRKIISITTKRQNNSQVNFFEQEITDLYEVNENILSPIITGMIKYESISTFTTLGHDEKVIKQQPKLKINHTKNGLSITILQTIENIRCEAQKCKPISKKKEGTILLNYKDPNFKEKNKIIKISNDQ